MIWGIWVGIALVVLVVLAAIYWLVIWACSPKGLERQLEDEEQAEYLRQWKRRYEGMEQ